MVIQNKTVLVYDIEVFPNVFTCTVKNSETKQYQTFEISERANHLTDVVRFFRLNTGLLCGYNNKNYDDVVINYIIDLYDKLRYKSYLHICQSLYNLSQYIIETEDTLDSKLKQWKYAKFFDSMDLLRMLFSSKLRVGLKEMQVTMHYKNVQEFSGDFSRFLSVDRIDEMIKYNINDVESTETLLNRCKKDIDLRIFIEDEYGIPCLSMDSVKFGETLLAKRYCEAIGISKKQLEEMSSPMDYVPLKDVILPIIQYKNSILQNVLREMKEQIVYTKERKGYEKKFVLSDTLFSVGVGGIHSINTPEIFVPKDDEYIGHLDVASMYPSFIVQYGWTPRHLGKDFLAVYEQIYHERITAKHSGQKLKSDALKLTLNSVTGKMQQETSWMYDPFSVFKIRINGQLVLLMLVDILVEFKCRIVQVNTDGVMFIAKKNIEKEIMESVSKLEQLTKLSFEAGHYEAFYQYAVNDYFAVVEGYSQSRDPKLIEKKGMFITEPRLGKGLAPVIIPKAVINYFLDKAPIQQTLKDCTDIKEFMMYQRIDKKFKVFHGDKQVQRINRFYASTNGNKLVKVNPEGQSENVLASSGITILNTMNEEPIIKRRINYAYYGSQARKIVNDFVWGTNILFRSV